MKKIIALVIVLAGLIAFFPFEQERTVTIHTPFLKTYNDLLHAHNWAKWSPVLLKNGVADTGKLVYSQSTNKFRITSDQGTIDVEAKGNVFYITDHKAGKIMRYNYLLEPAKKVSHTSLTVSRNGRLWNYLADFFASGLITATHADAFKHYMETDSLYYGEHIYKTRVPEKNLVVMKRSVLKSQQFGQAQLMLNELKQYVKHSGAVQKAPVIAQFWNKGADSVQVNVGLFVDKRLTANKEIAVVTMPYGGPLYFVNYNGPFKNRLKVYDGVDQYFKDRMYQQAIQPFETYLDDKLPSSENDTIHIKVNFTSFM
ncbi:hypothetical protein [Mucilaginibacter sp.]